MSQVDVVVVGAGPNGLAAAVTLARANLSVAVFEQGTTIGGGARTAEITLPGFRHDLGSAVHPMAVASPFFRRFRLAAKVPFVLPELSYAHPLPGGRAALAWRDLDRTAADLGGDGPAWRRMFAPLVAQVDEVARLAGGALLRPTADPRVIARFGLRALESGTALWNRPWRGEAAPALLTGVMGHAIRPLPAVGTAAVGLALGTYAHAGGWPIPIGGSAAIVDALAADLIAHGGTIATGTDVTDLRDLPTSRAVVFDTAVPTLISLAGDRVPWLRRVQLRRFRFGDAAAKVDFALDGPVPWADARVAGAAALHLGGTRAEIAVGEAEVAAGRLPRNPYVLVSQPTVHDPARAPAGKHVLWAYTHVPGGSTSDPVDSVTAAIERVAPGFRDLVLAATSTSAMEIERYDPNYGGGDIAAGGVQLRQMVARPILSADPWHLGDGIYLASSAAAPGPGVHGQAGYLAARSLLGREFGVRTPPSLS